MKRIELVSKASSIALPQSYYRYAIYECWKCNKDIIVFTWPSKNETWTGSKPVGIPIPSTIKKTLSKTVGDEYWANTCPYCSSLQGDFYLYGEPDGPFFAFSCSSDKPNDFVEDLTKLVDLNKDK